jgi:polyisoprenyl-phosphate glycosyltransferase
MNKQNTVNFSYIIPLFNEEENIETLYNNIITIAEKQQGSFECIFIDDGSTDKTFTILKEIALHDNRMKVLKLSRNFGHQSALTCGINHANATDAAIILDGDMQDPPSLIETFIQKWQNGYHVVYGIRKTRDAPLILVVCYKIFYRVLSLFSKVHIPVDAGDFSLLDKKVIDAIRSMPERMRYLRGIRAWIGFEQIGVPYVRPKRDKGTSKYSLISLATLAIDGFFAFSALPTHIIFIFGVLLFAISTLTILVLITARIFVLFTLPGWTSIFIGIIFFGSIQLFAITIVAIYCDKILCEIKARPHYIIDQTLNIRK